MGCGASSSTCYVYVGDSEGLARRNEELRRRRLAAEEVVEEEEEEEPAEDVGQSDSPSPKRRRARSTPTATPPDSPRTVESKLRFSACGPGIDLSIDDRAAPTYQSPRRLVSPYGGSGHTNLEHHTRPLTCWATKVSGSEPEMIAGRWSRAEMTAVCAEPEMVSGIHFAEFLYAKGSKHGAYLGVVGDDFNPGRTLASSEGWMLCTVHGDLVRYLLTAARILRSPLLNIHCPRSTATSGPPK